jgi:hypothetical protein
MDQPIDPAYVEAGYPEANSLADAAIANHQTIGRSDHERMHRVEPPEALVIGATIQHLLQLFDGADFRIGKLVKTSDPSPWLL